MLKINRILTAAVMVTSVASIPVLTPYADTNSTTEKRVMEKLDRGTVAVKTNDGVYLSWRLWVRKVLQIKHLIYTVTVKNIHNRRTRCNLLYRFKRHGG